MSQAMARWNRLVHEAAMHSILPCCGAKAWADAMAARRPFENIAMLLAASQQIWWNLEPVDWMEAFQSHPRIGEPRAAISATAKSQEWSLDEQRNVAEGSEAIKLALAEGNYQYERQFGRIFIVCATGKSPREILEILRRRLTNDDVTELRAAAEEQQQITQIRLRKWLKE